MSNTVTRFEVILPDFDSINFPDSYAAGQTFVTQMTSLLSASHLYTFASYDLVTNMNTAVIMGFLTTSQQSAALSYLSTLSANVDSSYLPLITIAWSATSEP